VIVVLDASVILKWLIEDPEREADTDRAIALVESVIDGDLEVLEPPHWLIEVGAVLARLSPETAVEDVAWLSALELPIQADPLVFTRAAQIAVETGQHLFDTLYHAIALEAESSMLITADNRYLAKAASLGRIVALQEWQGNA
jgi:predicted nucleic acid-binding protein